MGFVPVTQETFDTQAKTVKHRKAQAWHFREYANNQEVNSAMPNRR
jgi:hypothetical protein